MYFLIYLIYFLIFCVDPPLPLSVCWKFNHILTILLANIEGQMLMKLQTGHVVLV